MSSSDMHVIGLRYRACNEGSPLRQLLPARGINAEAHSVIVHTCNHDQRITAVDT
jgi:hypothetical protein